MWDALANNEVISCFQFDSAVGSQAAKKIRPRSALEMSDANGLMRLMTSEKGAEQPIDKYVRFKNNIGLWYKEMTEFGLTPDEQSALEPYFLPSYGVPPSQEAMMKILMDPKICGFTLAEANSARKIVGKKQLEKIPALREKVLDQALSPRLGQYVWTFGLGPQMGYSFSLIHALAYSFVGMQTLYLATRYNPLFWDTACLIVNSGALENAEDSTDYAKIAKAIGEIKEAGVQIGLLDINNSLPTFVPDTDNNQILFGLKGVSNVGDEIVADIIKHRPYSSPQDFLNKVRPKKPAMIALIKGGAFDSMMERKTVMAWYIWKTCDKKSNLTLQNMPTLMRRDMIPDDGDLSFAKSVYEFNRYLKAICLDKKKQIYNLDERAISFLCKIEQDHLIQENNTLNPKSWDKYYQLVMNIIRDWLSDNKNQVLQKLNDEIFMEDWNKYAKGNYAAWEMAALCFYFHPHELAHVDYDRYGLTNFFGLPTEPVVERSFPKGDKTINLFKLSRICGTCIAKNKTNGTVSLLTPEGVVTVRFRKEYFALFDKRISERGSDNKKHIKEYSWFDRGSMIMVQGIRSEDVFIPKKYKSSPGHQLYKIDEVSETGELVIRHERMQGEAEDDE